MLKTNWTPKQMAAQLAYEHNMLHRSCYRPMSQEARINLARKLDSLGRQCQAMHDFAYAPTLTPENNTEAAQEAADLLIVNTPAGDQLAMPTIVGNIQPKLF